MNIQFSTFPELGEYFKKFFTIYDTYIRKLTVCSPEFEPRYFKLRDERICRFCGKSMPEVTFGNDPHVIPRMLGNQYLISDYECDDCNGFFSNFETELAKYLGPIRTLYNVSGKKDNPTFKSASERIVVRKENFAGVKDAVKVSRQEGDDYSFRFNKEEGVTEVRFRKHRYVPIKVYKSLLKIALTVMPEEEIKHYSKTIKLLLNDDEKQLNRYAILHETFAPTRRTSPVAFIFQRREGVTRTYKHMFMLHFQTLILQLFIPFHDEDEKDGYYDNTQEIFVCPPICLSEPKESLPKDFNPIWREMGTSEPVSEEGMLSFNFDPASFDNVHVYDPKTGISKEHTGELPEFIGFYLVQADQRPDFTLNKPNSATSIE